jgi:hypothetical protein
MNAPPSRLQLLNESVACQLNVGLQLVRTLLISMVAEHCRVLTPFVICTLVEFAALFPIAPAVAHTTPLYAQLYVVPEY